MMWILGAIAVAIIACGTFLASGKFGEMPDLVDDHPVPRLPEDDFTGDDVRALRFATTLRGYAPHQVDDLMHRVAQQLDGSELRTRPLTGADLQAQVFDVLTRGHHMAQVDLVIDRLAEQLDRTGAPKVGAPTPYAE